MRSRASDRAALDRALHPTPSCIPIERFGQARTAAESEHLKDCVRCQTEFALWQEFDQSSPSADDALAVQWIVAELGRRAAQPAPPAGRAWRWLSLPRFAGAAATLAVAAMIGYGLWDREPSVRVHQDAQVYRTLRVQATAPLGDVAAAPHLLEWAAVAGAVAYDVQVLEVDRAALWHGSASEPRIEIPAQVLAQIVPGKTLLWEITARNGSGVVIAESGTQRFRVAVVARTLRNP